MGSKQVKITIEPEIAEAFKTACTNKGVSMTKELTRLMSDHARIATRDQFKNKGLIENRGGRRKELNKLIARIEAIRDAEDEYKNRIPENLQSGSAYESVEQTVEAIDQAIDWLHEAFS